MKKIDQACVNTIRFLACDAVEKAKSGHPGMPLGAATMAYVLWDRFLRHNPKNPKWGDRDRFVLSAGHGSALLYALLHLTGYDLPLDQLKQFRQLGSLTPGHPEHGLTAGVEVTTGPLGQGFAMAVGMAVAERHLAAKFNRPGFPIIDHYTYGIASDGDLMEGVASEAASLAGTLGLGKLIFLYDDNHISIEGSTDLAFTENVRLRFQAYGWQVITVPDGNDIDLIDAAIRLAREEKERPSLIAVRTRIGFGSPKQDSASSHGEPLGAEALAATRQTLVWPDEPMFYVPDEVKAHFAEALDRFAEMESAWLKMTEDYRARFPEEASIWAKTMAGEMPAGWEDKLPVFAAGSGMATREASGKVMNALAEMIPNLMGGSADLAPSTKTTLAGLGEFSATQPEGQNMHFGVREHAMGAVVNGMALHGGLIPFGSTFFVFSDFMRPSLRLAALMELHSIFVFTHDSIGVGEDGPTHQPIEHLMTLRAIPGLVVIRPADANETRAAWEYAIKAKRPTVLVLTRQKLANFDPDSCECLHGVSRGAYVLKEERGQIPQVVIVATGSEVEPSLKAWELLKAKGCRARVVSMPSWELFDEQPEKYRRGVLPAGVPVLTVEAGITLGWKKYIDGKGMSLGIDRFGASGPGPVLMEHFGFTPENIAAQALKVVEE